MLKIGTKVRSPSGDGIIINYVMRKNTNGGPGTRQYLIRLSDNRIRRHSKNEVSKIE